MLLDQSPSPVIPPHFNIWITERGILWLTYPSSRKIAMKSDTSSSENDVILYRVDENEEVTSQRLICSSNRVQEDKQIEVGESMNTEIQCSPLPSEYNFLYVLSTEYSIYLWEKDGKVDRIDFLAFPLTFIREGDGLVCTAPRCSGWRLSSRPITPLSEMDLYIPLERVQEDGKILQQFLLPTSPPEPTSGGLSTLTKSNPENRGYVVVALDEKGQFVPENAHARYVLARLLLWKHRYEESMTLLRGDESRISAMTQVEREVLENIANSHDNHDTDPRAYEVKVYACLLLFVDSLYYSNEFTISESHIQDLWRNYLERFPSLAKDFLSNSERELALRMDAKFTQILADYGFDHRFSKLSSFYSEITAQQFLWNDPRRVSKKLLADTKHPFKNVLRTVTEFEPPALRYSIEFLEKVSATVVEDIYTRSQLPLVISPFNRLYILMSNVIKGLLSGPPTAVGVDVLQELIRPQPPHRSFSNVYPYFTRQFDPPLRYHGLNFQELSSVLNEFFEIPVPLESTPEQLLIAYDLAIYAHIPFFMRQNIYNHRVKFLDFGLTTLYDLSKVFVQALPRPSNVEPLQKPKQRPTPPPQRSVIEAQVCLSTDPQPLLHTPLIGDLDQWIERRDQTIAYDPELAESLELEGADSLATRCSEALAQSVREYQIAHPVEPVYALKEPKALQTLSEKITGESKRLQTVLSETEANLIYLANRDSAVPVDRVKKRLEIKGLKRNRVELRDLFQLVLRMDAEPLQLQNPALTLAEIRHLRQETIAYLVQLTRLQQLERAQKRLQAAQKSKSSDLHIALRSFVEELTTVRQYPIDRHPEYLIIEVTLNILMRTQQVEMLKEFKAYNRFAGELIMGAGKTTVIDPLLAYTFADGEKVPILVMPSELIPSMTKDLIRTMHRGFSQAIDAIEFHRESDYSSKNLDEIFLRLDSIRDEKRTLVLSEQSIKNNFLSFIEALDNENEITAFRKNLIFLKRRGKVVIDELDTILNALREHLYAIGTPLPPKEEARSTISDLYFLLILEPEIAQKIHLPFVKGSSEKVVDEEAFRKELRPLFVEKILRRGVALDVPSVRRFFAQLSGTEREMVRLYLLNARDEAAEKFVDAIEAIEVKNCLRLIQEELDQGLALTLSRFNNFHYGKHTNPKVYGAIPYHGPQSPALQSELGTEIELINYTIQMYLEEGISLEILETVVEEFKGRITKEKGRTQAMTVNTRAYGDFTRVFGIPLPGIMKSGEKEFHLLQSHLDAPEQFDKKLRFIQRFILPHLKLTLKTYALNSLIFDALFDEILGMSGTLWNHETYGKVITRVLLSNTEAQTLNALWANSPHAVQKIATRNAQRVFSLQDRVDAILNREGGFQGTFIDAAALFKDDDPQAVAYAWLHSKHWKVPPKGIVFYNAENERCLLVRGQEKPQKLDAADGWKKQGLKHEEIVVFFDFKHTTGANDPLVSDARATITIGKHTNIRTLCQAVWRLRGLLTGQKIDFVVADEVHAEICSALNLPSDTPLLLKHIFQYTLLQQIKDLRRDLPRSAKQAIEGVLIKAVVGLLLDSSISDELLLAHFSAFAPLFKMETSIEPYRSLGAPTKKVDAAVAIDRSIRTVLDSSALKAIKNVPEFNERFDVEALEKEIRGLGQELLKLLPDELVIQNTPYGREVEKQAERQQEKESQKENEKSLEMNKELSLDLAPLASAKPRTRAVWDNGALYDWGQYRGGEQQSLFGSLLNGIGSWLLDWGRVRGAGLPLRPYPLLNITGLLCSDNLFPAKQQPNTYRYEPYGLFQKEIKRALLVKHEGIVPKYRLALIDLDENVELDRVLTEEAWSPAPKRPIQLALFRLDSERIVRQGAYPMEEDAVMRDVDFIRLKTQAKFVAGMLKYSDSEIKIIREWVIGEGACKMQRFFTEQVLSFKPMSRRAYPYSSIATFFSEFDC
ncbi:MAG: DUF3638 domain-containing protein [Chlamydiia bacterium]|nr:DUF3638 domain-containing protein [Chlamydiia bacterium]